MGLDSIELVISIEKHFAITISDAEAEKTFTVQDVADLVAKHRPLVPRGGDVRVEVREKLLTLWSADRSEVPDHTPFTVLCRERTPYELWSTLPLAGLKVPDLPPADQSPRPTKSLLSFLIPKWAPGRTINGLTFGEVLDAIIAHNHTSLIDPLRPRSRYEILMAVIGVSSDSIGVPELEIRPTDSYTSDLGVD